MIKLDEKIKELVEKGIWNQEPTTNPDKPLTERQKKFVDLVSKNGLTPRQALRHVNKGSNAGDLAEFQGANVQKALRTAEKISEKAVMMTKKRVMEGFLEAVDMAKMKGDPFVMISGWREIAKMCGYYEAVKVKVDVNVNHSNYQQKLQTLTDTQLLALAEGKTDDNFINGEGVIDGDEDPRRNPHELPIIDVEPEPDDIPDKLD